MESLRQSRVSTAATLPATNSSHLKMDGWNTTFLLGRPIFRGELLVSREGITCYTTQHAECSINIIHRTVFCWFFGNEETTSNGSFFTDFFPARRKGKQILRWQVRMHDDSGSCRHATCLNSARQIWHAPLSKCQGTTVSWGPQFTKLARHLTQLPPRNISIKLKNLRSKKCTYGYHGSQQIRIIRIVPHELWSGNSFPKPLFRPM